MKLKFQETETGICLTDCPINEGTRIVKINSKTCSECRFYRGASDSHVRCVFDEFKPEEL